MLFSGDFPLEGFSVTGHEKKLGVTIPGHFLPFWVRNAVNLPYFTVIYRNLP